MAIRFVFNEPALYIDDIDALVIGDLHIGFEYELGKSGINIPAQIREMLKKIDKLLKQTKAKHLIILGDVKHQVPGVNYLEERDIPKFFDSLKDKVKISVCLGNHDTFLKDMLPEDIEVYDSKGFKIKIYGFFHGHAWPKKELLESRYLITSHIHPTLLFVDKLGHRIIEPVWIKCILNKEKIEEKFNVKPRRIELLVMPAFNKLLSGSNINVSKIKKEFINPVMNEMIDKDKCELYLLDGTYLGRLKDFD
ncbi:MAG: metallophosphoesterase [Candidatus Aenigmatarchaeota archaeon]|nr:metallophosphoesterase [Candidatus Aenigmarchaeota archaeon]